ncbi:MAG: gamma-glutamylcyclotransferase [Candidatus Korobacteraceae bacterium]
MSDYLFSYGTLLPEHAPAEIATAVSKLRPVGKGTVSGVLYDLGDYPGAVLDFTSDKRIFGTVFRLPNNSAVLDELDEYEGFHPSASRKSLFIRRRCPVRLSTGRALNCWIYEYNGKHVAAPVVANGRYRSKHPAMR